MNKNKKLKNKVINYNQFNTQFIIIIYGIQCRTYCIYLLISYFNFNFQFLNILTTSYKRGITVPQSVGRKCNHWTVRSSQKALK